MSQRVRIGFVGVGSMGQCAHLKNYVTVPECEVVAISEPRPKLREAVARKYNIPRTYATGEEMIAKEKLDGIVASQMFDRHAKIIPPLYKAGIPIFTEKPIAANVELGEKILAALKASGAWHMVGYHKRSDPATMYAKAEIDRLKQTGELGKLTYIRIIAPSGDWIANGFSDLIQTDEKIPDSPRDVNESWESPHYCFVNGYIHQVNLLRHLLGESYRVTFAEKSQLFFATESQSGVPGIIELGPYWTKQDWQEAVLVCFQKGWVKIELPPPLAANRACCVEICTEQGLSAPQMPPIHAMRQQAINFVRALRGEIKPLCEAAEALEDLRIADEFFRVKDGK